MVGKVIFSFLLTITTISGLSAQPEELIMNTFYALPGKTKPDSADLSARGVIRLQGDSIVVELQITDDQVVLGEDRVDVWLALPEVQFSDYLLGKSGGKTRIFRNSSESGEVASLERFLKNGDYPKQRKLAVDGVSREVTVPPADALIEDYVHFGMAQYSFLTGASSAKHANRAQYKALESQLEGIPDDMSAFTAARFERSANGYTLKMALHHHCMVFSAFQLPAFKIVVDVFDVDAPGDKPLRMSSTPNRFTHRPFYFHSLKAGSQWRFTPAGVEEEALKKTSIQLLVFRKKGQWQAMGFGAGAIIFTEGLVSEAGLVEYNFYPIECRYRKMAPPFDAVEEIRLRYDDVSPFEQHDIYFIQSNQVTISKGYRYLSPEAEIFVNQPFFLPDGRMAFVLYDYEPADHLGWGEYGRMADEFIYIQVPGSTSTPLFSCGLRLEVLRTANFGELDKLSCEQVKSVGFEWIEKGKSFSISVKGIQRDADKQIVFGLDASGVYRRIP